MKIEAQKIVIFLNDGDDEFFKFVTRKWYIINDQNNGQFGEGNEKNLTIKLEKKVVKPNPCDYSNAYILVTGDITTTGGDANTKFAFKHCAPFKKCVQI